jgi:hypothetical protein
MEAEKGYRLQPDQKRQRRCNCSAFFIASTVSAPVKRLSLAVARANGAVRM